MRANRLILEVSWRLKVLRKLKRERVIKVTDAILVDQAEASIVKRANLHKHLVLEVELLVNRVASHGVGLRESHLVAHPFRLRARSLQNFIGRHAHSDLLNCRVTGCDHQVWIVIVDERLSDDLELDFFTDDFQFLTSRVLNQHRVAAKLVQVFVLYDESFAHELAEELQIPLCLLLEANYSAELLTFTRLLDFCRLRLGRLHR